MADSTSHSNSPDDLEELNRQNEELRATCAAMALERQQFEAALRESEARYQKLVESLPDATALMLDRERRLLRTVIDNLPDQIFARDRACRFTLNNLSDARVMGVDNPDRLLGKSDEDFYPPELAALYQADDRQVMETGRPLIDREEPSVAPGGGLRWTLTSKVPLRDSQGEVIGLVGIARDITERKRAEAEIKRLNEELEKRVAERTSQLAAANEILQREIAERQRAEAVLDHERRLLRTVIDAVPDQIFAHDQEGRFILNNRSDAEILGVADPEILLGKNDRDFYPPELAARFQADDQQVIESGQALINREEPSVAADGSQHWKLTTKVPLRDSRGQIIGLVGVAHDITERKQADMLIQAQKKQLEAQNEVFQAQNEELIAQAGTLERTETELRRLNAELEERVATRTAELSARTQELSLANNALVRAARMKDEFLASMSHELRTPLTGILGLSELLLMGIYGSMPSQQLTPVQTIHESGEHLLDLINDILDVAKIEAGKVELQLTSVRVLEVCETSLQFVRQQAQKKNLRLSLKHDPDVTILQADARRLKQMLVNLLSNAVKFTAAGGAVSLEVAGDKAQHQVQLTVADTGIGIAPQDLPRLFKPFVQLDSRLSREYEGTGLGLSLVMGLAELHGGSVQVDSDGVPGRGSRFTITLPWSGEPDNAPGLALSTAGRPSAVRPVRQALMVEDSPEAAEQLTRYLADLGITGAVHSTGHGAVEKAAEVTPDVILLDILLPDVSGWEVLTQLKADPRTRDLPVIVVSVVEEREKAEAMGVVGYLVKPVSFSDLQTVLYRGMQRAAARQAPSASMTADKAARPGPVVLLADDSDIILSTLGDFLRSQAYEVVISRRGDEALEKARQFRPAVILMDIQMPVLDGLEAIRRLRAEADPELASTPIIALTALAMSSDRERCLAAGANAYVPKPVNLEILGQIIETQLERHPR